MTTPRYPANPDAPQFTPELWIKVPAVKEGEKAQSIYSNCYQYSIAGSYADGSNRLFDEFAPSPGMTKGLLMGPEAYATDAMRSLVKEDGLTLASKRHDQLPSNKPGQYVIGIYIENLATKTNPHGNKDYHFVRQDADGGWSEKPGRESIAYVDRFLPPAKDGGYQALPSNYGKNYKFAGYAYVPKGGIDGGLAEFLIPNILHDGVKSDNTCLTPNSLFTLTTDGKTTIKQDAVVAELKEIGATLKKHRIPQAVETYENCLSTFDQALKSKRPQVLTPTPNWS